MAEQIIKMNLPAEYDAAETEVDVYYEIDNGEPESSSCPGHDAYVEFHRVLDADGRDYSLEPIDPDWYNYISGEIMRKLAEEYQAAMEDRHQLSIDATLGK